MSNVVWIVSRLDFLEATFKSHLLNILRGIAVVMELGLSSSLYIFSVLFRIWSTVGSTEVGSSRRSSFCFRTVIEWWVMNQTNCSQVVSLSSSAASSFPHILLLAVFIVRAGKGLANILPFKKMPKSCCQQIKRIPWTVAIFAFARVDAFLIEYLSNHGYSEWLIIVPISFDGAMFWLYQK